MSPSSGQTGGANDDTSLRMAPARRAMLRSRNFKRETLMTVRHLALSGALMATLLLAACHPIPKESIPKASPPAPTLTPEPMQANLNDFAFAFSVIFEEEVEPEAYAEIISKIDNCFRFRSPEDTRTLHTPGRAAAIQWVSIMLMTINMDSGLFENVKPQTSSFYNRLVQLHESCMEN